MTINCVMMTVAMLSIVRGKDFSFEFLEIEILNFLLTEVRP